MCEEVDISLDECMQDCNNQCTVIDTMSCVHSSWGL